MFHGICLPDCADSGISGWKPAKADIFLRKTSKLCVKLGLSGWLPGSRLVLNRYRLTKFDLTIAKAHARKEVVQTPTAAHFLHGFHRSYRLWNHHSAAADFCREIWRRRAD